MPGDGVLSIGATVDKTGVEAGFSAIQDGAKTMVQTIAVQVEETCARTKAAWNKLGEDVKVAAQSVSAESLKVAEATKAQTAALADLRRASVLTKDANIKEAESTAILAAAQTKVAASSAAIALAKKEEAAAVIAAAEEEALSSNFIVAAFQRCALGVRESCMAIQEKLVETAEISKFSAEGMTAGFAGLSSLLGAGIAVGFAAHFIDETAKVNVELGHLAEKSGIGVSSLAALREMVKETGGDFEAIGTGIVRMSKNLADSGESSKALVAALGGINLKVSDLQGLKPEQQFYKIAAGFGGTTNEGNKAAAAIALFGRGGQALIPILNEQGAALEANIKLKQQDAGVTDQSVAASQRWVQNMAKLTEGFQRFGNFAIENMHYLEAAFDAVGATMQTVFEGIGTIVVALAKEIYALGKAFYDIQTLNIKAFGDDFHNIMHAAVDEVKSGAKDIGDAWKSVGDLWKGQPATTRKSSGISEVGDAGDPAGGQDAGSGSGGGGGSSAGGQAARADAVRQAMQAAADVSQRASLDFMAMQTGAETAARAEASSVLAIFKSIDDARAASMKKAADDLAKQQQKMAQDWEKVFSKMSSELNKNLSKWIVDGGSFGASMRKSFDGMAQDLIKSTLKMGERWLAHEALMTAAHLAGLATRKSADAGAAALSNAQLMVELSKWIAAEWAKVTHHVAANTAKTTSDVKASVVSASAGTAALAKQITTNSSAATSFVGVGAAAAGAGVAATSGPAAPVAGPAAAAAYAAAMSPFLSMSLFDTGGIMGTGKMGVNLSGADERVLSPSQTQNFDRMVNQSTSNNTSKEVHFHDHSNWNGVDGASVEGMYRKHAATGRREMMRQLRLANQI